jgi:hypothetical protein
MSIESFKLRESQMCVNRHVELRPQLRPRDVVEI